MILGTWLPKFETIYGKDGLYDTPYLSRMIWGRLRIHCFHRGDNDPDCHDHQWDFWTFPLSKNGYYEEVMVKVLPGYRNFIYAGQRLAEGEHYLRVNQVPGRKWTHVKAEHRHRVLYPCDADGGFFMVDTHRQIVPERRSASAFWPIWTIVWTSKVKRPTWGFWQIDGRDKKVAHFIQWQQYIFGDNGAASSPSTVNKRQGKEEAERKAA